MQNYMSEKYSVTHVTINHVLQKHIPSFYVQVTVHTYKLRIKQLDASNIQHLFCHKTLRVSGIFCAHHQELSTVRTAIGTYHAGYA